MILDLPNLKFEHLYAVVRFDFPVNPEYPENSVTIVKAFSTRPAAEKEASRLNELKKEKGCRYKFYIFRYAS